MSPRVWFTCSLYAVLSLVAAPVLRGQTRAAEPSVPATTLSPRLRAAIDRLADSARAIDVPVEPLYLKAAEGALKGADDDRVVVVVGRMLAELGEARHGLGHEATSAELMAGASVVHAGLDAAVLQRIRAARPGGRTENALVMPLVVLADLVARHVTPGVATGSVIALAQRGAADAEFANLRSVVEREIQLGQPPDAATRARTASILGGISGETRPERRAAHDPVSRP